MGFCVITFFLGLILFPGLFLVTKFNILNIVSISTLFFCNLYIIEFLESVYDKIVKRFYKGAL